MLSASERILLVRLLAFVGEEADGRTDVHSTPVCTWEAAGYFSFLSSCLDQKGANLELKHKFFSAGVSDHSPPWGDLQGQGQQLHTVPEEASRCDLPESELEGRSGLTSHSDS